MTNDDTISRQAAIEELKGLPKYTLLDQKDCLRGVGIRLKFAEQALKNLPSAQPKSTEQIKWERDTAVEQLKELGYGLGEKIIHCKDCKYNCFNAEAGIAKCCIFHAKTNLYGFCYLGERRTDAEIH